MVLKAWSSQKPVEQAESQSQFLVKTARRKRAPNESSASEGAESLGITIKEERGGDKTAPLVKEYVQCYLSSL
jgi:hypothetical protein